MNLWSRITTFLVPVSLEDRRSLQEIREALLTIILRIASILGFVALLGNLPSLLRSRLWIYLIIYVLSECWLLGAAHWSRLPYTLRVVSSISLLYILGVSASLQFATTGDGRIWMIGLVILTTIFLGLGAGLSTTFISTGTLIFIGLMMSYQIIPPPIFTTIGLPGQFSTWLTTGISYFLISTILVSSIAALVNTLNRTSREHREMALKLEADRTLELQHSAELQRHQQQLYVAAEIAAILGRQPDLNTLLQTVVNLLHDRFELYYCGVFLLDEQESYAILRAGTGEAGQKMRAANHKLAVGGSSMIGWCTANRKARIALDTGLEAIRFNNPLLPLTRSELALPIMLGEQVLGALTIQSQRPNAFDQVDITILQGIANSLATAIENIQLVQQLQHSLKQVQRLNQQYVVAAWSRETTLEEMRGYELENPKVTDSIPETRTIRAPLTLRGATIGEITIEGGQPWGENDETFAQAIATQTAQALENARLVRETLQQAQREQVVTAITEQVRASLDLETILRTSVREIQNALKLKRVRIQLYEDASLQEKSNTAVS
ncbi:MAG: hypothetical protein Fur0018_12560 [Anaerolineales bacterium]